MMTYKDVKTLTKKEIEKDEILRLLEKASEYLGINITLSPRDKTILDFSWADDTKKELIIKSYRAK